MQILQKIIKFARKPRTEKLESVRYHLADRDWYWKFHRSRNEKTAYFIGLFGTGRWYVTELIRQNIGQRAKYWRNEIRFRPRGRHL